VLSIFFSFSHVFVWKKEKDKKNRQCLFAGEGENVRAPSNAFFSNVFIKFILLRTFFFSIYCWIEELKLVNFT